MIAIRLLVVSLVWTCSAAAADLWVVDSDGGADFPNVDLAVAAASSGDVILVRPGAAFAYFVTPLPADKSLTLVADTDESTPVRLTELTIDGLLEDLTLVVRGFSIGFTPGGAPISGSAPVCVQDAQGNVFIEDCALDGLDGSDLCDDATPGVVLSQSASVTLTRCTITGGDGIDGLTALFCGGSPGEPAAVVSGTSVAFYDCSLEGGAGGNEDQQLGGPRPAGHGLEIGGGAVVTLAGTSVAGGDSPVPPLFPGAGEAGDGLVIEAPATVRSIASTFEPGLGLDAVAIDDRAGVLESSGGVARSLAVPSPLGAGEPGVLALDGVAGDDVVLFLSVEAGMLPLPLPKGALTLGPPLVGPFVVGTISSPAGELDLPFVAPPLPPAGGDALLVLIQAVFQDAAGAARLGSPSSLAIVDTSA